MRKVLVTLAVAGFCLLVLPGAAGAAGLAPAVADCYTHGGVLTRSYTAAQLRSGLATMPADIREYSDCYDVLDRALLQKIGKLSGGDSAGGGGSFLPIWLIVLLAVLVVGGTGFGAMALRNRGAGGEDGSEPA
jgi:hypothetical protein